MSATVQNLSSRRPQWVVVKFGGTSVANPAHWRQIERILRRHLEARSRVLVVCSAVATITDRLQSIVHKVESGASPQPVLREIARIHRELAASMDLDGASLLGAELGSLEALAARLHGSVSARDQACLLAHGELLSTRLGSAWLAGRGFQVARVDARELLQAQPGDGRAEDFLAADVAARPCAEARARLDATGAHVVVTQGYIARNAQGDTVLLGRGGSDASAAYLAVAVEARAAEIWTDVPGMFTTDPRSSQEARRLEHLSYAEAEALAVLGAKVLHPRTVAPLRSRDIPLYVGWTARPDLPGTRVSGAQTPRGIKAVVARRDLALLVMTRPSSWQPVGFMAEVAARFQRRRLSMDLLASSWSEIRATIDLSASPGARGELEQLCSELAEVCEPRLVTRVGSVSLVGWGLSPADAGCTALSAALAKLHVHLFAHGANGTHLSYVVSDEDVPQLSACAHRALLENARESGTNLSGVDANAQAEEADALATAPEREAVA